MASLPDLGELNRAEHIGPAMTGDNIDAKKVANYVWNADTNQWQAMEQPTGGDSMWGDITGTLSDQTDLQSVLDAKANTDAVVQRSGDTMTGPLTITGYEMIDGATSTARSIFYATNGLKRWELQTTNGAESGGNVGSDWGINTYDDSGNYLNTPWNISRSSGYTNIFLGMGVSRGIATDTLTIGDKLKVTVGANKSAGSGTLSSGTATISTTAVTASSLIFLTDATSSLTNVGVLSVSSKSAGTGFTVTSANVLDTSTFNWLIIN